MIAGSRMKSGREFQTVGPASEKARRPETRYCKQLTVGRTQMPPSVSTGDRDAVVRQVQWCTAVQTPMNSVTASLKNSQFFVHCVCKNVPLSHSKPVSNRLNTPVAREHHQCTCLTPTANYAKYERIRKNFSEIKGTVL